MCLWYQLISGSKMISDGKSVGVGTTIAFHLQGKHAVMFSSVSSIAGQPSSADSDVRRLLLGGLMAKFHF